MQKGSTVILSITIIALLFLQGITPGIAASQKEQCEAGVREEFNEYKANNAADTKRDGNMVLHSFGCAECSSQYQTCEDTVDTAVTDCARASGWSPTNTCNADREANYYACADQLTDCCLPGELVTRCGSLTTTEPTSIPNKEELQEKCLDDGHFWFNDQCLDGDDALSYCKGMLGARGYPSSATECDRCSKGYAYDGSTCAVDPTCPDMQNGIYDASQGACVCIQGYAPTADGGCQKTERKYLGINIPNPGKIIVKGGSSQTTKISFPASLAKADNGALTLKCSIDSMDDGIRDITFSPSSVLITPGGNAQSMTITTYAQEVEEYHIYNAVMRCSGYDSKNLYASTITLTIDIVQPDTAFVPEPTTETVRKFKEIRDRQVVDIVTGMQFGEERAKTLFATLDQLNDENPEDLKIMATFVAFVNALDSSLEVGTKVGQQYTSGVLTKSLLAANVAVVAIKENMPTGSLGNPFVELDAELFAETLLKVAENRLSLEKAHKTIQESLKAGEKE